MIWYDLLAGIKVRESLRHQVVLQRNIFINITIDNVDFNCQLLMRLEQSIQEKRSELINRKDVVFHYDNARLHIFDDSIKIERAWLGSFNAFIV